MLGGSEKVSKATQSTELEDIQPCYALHTATQLCTVVNNHSNRRSEHHLASLTLAFEKSDKSCQGQTILYGMEGGR